MIILGIIALMIVLFVLLAAATTVLEERIRRKGYDQNLAKGERRPALWMWRKRLIVFAYKIMMALSSLYAWAILVAFVSWLVMTLPPLALWVTTKWWCIPLLIIFAYALYLLRAKVRSLYGLLETVVGSAAIVTAVMQPSNGDLAHLLAVIGGVYIVVRGLDNFNEGLKDLYLVLPKRTWDSIAELWYRLKLDREGFEDLRRALDAKYFAPPRHIPR